MCIIASTLFALIYIVFARFERLSFDRKEKYVLHYAEQSLKIAEMVKQDVQRRRFTIDRLSSKSKVAIFIIGSTLLQIVVMISTAFYMLNSVLVSLLILWKSMSLGNMTVLVHKLTGVFGSLFATFNFPYEYFYYPLYPFIAIMNAIGDIDFTALYEMLTVVCSGAKAPIVLFIDCMVLGVVIIFLKSNYHILWAISLQNMSRTIVQHHVFSSTNTKRWGRNSYLHLLVFVITSANPFILILRYFLSAVNFGIFFKRNHIMHELTPACIHIIGYEGQELILVYATSMLVWFLIPPMLYIIAEVLCPAGGKHMIRNIVEGRKSSRVSPHEPEERSKNDGCLSPYFWYFSSWIGTIFSSDLWLAYLIGRWLVYADKDLKIKNNLELRSNQRWKSNAILPNDEMIAKLAEEHKANNEKGFWFRGKKEKNKSGVTQTMETKKRIDKKWQKRIEHQLHLPLYHHLCVMEVQEFLNYTPGGRRSMLYYPLCIIFGATCIGHVITKCGRQYWAVVIRKYILFGYVCLGIWTEETVEAFELEQLLVRFSREDPNDEIPRLMPLVVGSRAILLQCISPFFAMLSVIFITLCGFPLFCYSKKMAEWMPPLICWDPYQRAVRQQMSEIYGEVIFGTTRVELDNWSTNLLSISIFMSESRIINFVMSTLGLIFVFVLIFFEAYAQIICTLMFALFVPYLMAAALKSVVFLGAVLKLKDADFEALHIGCLITRGKDKLADAIAMELERRRHDFWQAVDKKLDDDDDFEVSDDEKNDPFEDELGHHDISSDSDDESKISIVLSEDNNHISDHKKKEVDHPGHEGLYSGWTLSPNLYSNASWNPSTSTALPSTAYDNQMLSFGNHNFGVGSNTIYTPTIHQDVHKPIQKSQDSKGTAAVAARETPIQPNVYIIQASELRITLNQNYLNNRPLSQAASVNIVPSSSTQFGFPLSFDQNTSHGFFVPPAITATAAAPSTAAMQPRPEYPRIQPNATLRQNQTNDTTLSTLVDEDPSKWFQNIQHNSDGEDSLSEDDTLSGASSRSVVNESPHQQATVKKDSSSCSDSMESVDLADASSQSSDVSEGRILLQQLFGDINDAIPTEDKESSSDSDDSGSISEEEDDEDMSLLSDNEDIQQDELILQSDNLNDPEYHLSDDSNDDHEYDEGLSITTPDGEESMV